MEARSAAALEELFEDAFTARDADAVAALFEDDAVLVAPNGDLLRGRRAIAGLAEELWTAEMAYLSEVTQVLEAGDIAVVGVRWSISDRDRAVDDSGEGVDVARRQPDGTWRYVVSVTGAASGAAAPRTSASMAHRLVAAVEKGDVDVFVALFADDALGHHPLSPDPLRGRAELRAAEDALFTAFSDVKVDVRSVLADERTCALEVVLRAVNTGPLDVGGDTPLPPTGRAVEVPATWWYRLGDDGLIVEAHDYFDTSAFLSQLGFGDGANPAPQSSQPPEAGGVGPA